MMFRTIAAISALWCVLAIVPALVAGYVLESGPGGSAIGWLAGIWIVGYICQFVLFVMLGRRAPVGTGFGRVLAAFVPWLADGVAPVSPWLVVPFAAIVIGYAVWLTKAVYRVDVLRRDGMWATGVVVQAIRPRLNVVLKNDKTRRTMRVHVIHPDGRSPYEARFDGVYTVGEIPEPGDRLTIRIDPTRPTHVEQVEGEPVVRSAANIPQLDARDAARLHTLTMMRDRGDLTDEEYSDATRRLLGG
jgi:hypothetical protein